MAVGARGVGPGDVGAVADQVAGLADELVLALGDEVDGELPVDELPARELGPVLVLLAVEVPDGASRVGALADLTAASESCGDSLASGRRSS